MMKSQTMSILLIEDNPDHVFLTRQAVHTAWRDVSLFVTCNLDEVRTIRHSPCAPARFDLILAALDMRDPHRLAHLREMQASGEINDAPIIALVGSTREQELARVAHQPKEWIILKPLRAESLREAIRRRPLPRPAPR
jgi:CheY-like chemotaxis protein